MRSLLMLGLLLTAIPGAAADFDPAQPSPETAFHPIHYSNSVFDIHLVAGTYGYGADNKGSGSSVVSVALSGKKVWGATYDYDTFRAMELAETGTYRFTFSGEGTFAIVDKKAADATYAGRTADAMLGAAPSFGVAVILTRDGAVCLSRNPKVIVTVADKDFVTHFSGPADAEVQVKVPAGNQHYIFVSSRDDTKQEIHFAGGAGQCPPTSSSSAATADVHTTGALGAWGVLASAAICLGRRLKN